MPQNKSMGGPILLPLPWAGQPKATRGGLFVRGSSFSSGRLTRLRLACPLGRALHINPGNGQGEKETSAVPCIRSCVRACL